jgi:exodeoxyribonuclease VIII
MKNTDYHAHPAISKSHLDLIARSPLHYWARYLDPKRVAPEPTAAMRLGTALHTHVLELSRWDEEIAVAPVCDRRTKAGKDAFASFEASSAGKTVITADDAEVVMAMGRSIMRHPGAAMLLGLPGKAETTHMWTDATYGVDCKCRPDWLTDDGSIMVDLKTTRDASPRGFRRSIGDYRYHVQAGWYMHGVQAATGKRPDQFIFICVETTAPYAVAVYAADAEMIERGYEQAMFDLGKLATCRAADSWPSYSDQIETISLPSWMTAATSQQQATTEIETY